jgi:hypothetical protein
VCHFGTSVAQVGHVYMRDSAYVGTTMPGPGTGHSKLFIYRVDLKKSSQKLVGAD